MLFSLLQTLALWNINPRARLTGYLTACAECAPNPFRGSVSFQFSLPAASHVTVGVYGADGRFVQTVTEGDYAAGPHTVVWNVNRSVRSGMYYYKVLAGSDSATGKLTRID